MNEEIKFSIVIPAYGVEKYISDALGALMHQTYDNFEVIIVDDCSPDRTGSIVQKFCERDDRFFYYRHEVNQGVSRARNTGIEKATGDYILFLDPDDIYETRLLEVVAKNLMRNRVDVLVYGHTEDYRNPSSGKVEYSKKICLSDLEYEDDVFTTNDAVTIHKLAIQMERITMYGYPWNKVYNLSVIRANELEYQTIKHIEDILFNAEYFEYVESMTIVSDVLYHYRNQGQDRLTGGQIKDYFELQSRRVIRLYNQQQMWKTCDFEALGILSAEYFRSFQSNVMRMIDDGANEDEILAWCNLTAQSEMYNELKGYLPDDSKAVKMLYQPAAQGLFGTVIRRAKMMRFAKKYFRNTFNMAKQIR